MVNIFSCGRMNSKVYFKNNNSTHINIATIDVDTYVNTGTNGCTYIWEHTQSRFGAALPWQHFYFLYRRKWPAGNHRWPLVRCWLGLDSPHFHYYWWQFWADNKMRTIRRPTAGLAWPNQNTQANSRLNTLVFQQLNCKIISCLCMGIHKELFMEKINFQLNMPQWDWADGAWVLVVQGNSEDQTKLRLACKETLSIWYPGKLTSTTAAAIRSIIK